MIVADFLPRDDTLFAITDPVELTESVDDLALSYPNGWPDAYWYGWMRWENVPDALKLTTIEMSGEGYDLTVSADYGSPRNFNVGYMAAGLEDSALNWYINLYGARGFIENSGVHLDPVSNISPLFGSRFINSLDPRGVCPIHGGSSNTEYHSICFVFQVQRVYNGDERDGYNNFSFHTFSDFTQTDGNAIEEFLNGDYSINLKQTGYTLWDNTPAVSYYCDFDFDLNINDSEHFGVEHPNTWTFRFNYSGVEHILNVFICGFGFPRGADAISENAGYEYKTFGISPVVSQNIEGINFKSIGAQNYYNFVKFNSLGQLVNYDSGLIHNNFYSGNQSYGGYNGSVNIVDNGKNCYGITFDNEANYAVVMERHSGGPTADNLWCFRILSPDEIRHTMCLNMRYVTNDDYTQYSYGFGEGIYVPKITEDNEFLGEWLTGDFEDIQDELRPWQYGNITDDDYNPEDLPPYGPDEPVTDKDEGNIPLNIPGSLGATSAFVTQYVLNTTQIQEIGGSLWENLSNTNTNMWRNFWLRITGSSEIDYSLSYTEILQYFLSLKYFPFNLSSISGSTGYNGIYVGTGVTIIPTTSTTRQLYDSRITLDGGIVNIPNKWNNYLDMEPYTSASIYIPYCGTIEIPMSVISGSLLKLTYSVDLITGNIIGIVTKQGNVSYPIAVGVGTCGFDIMMTGTNGNQQISSHIQNIASKATQWTGQILSSGVSGLMGGITGSAGGGEGGAMAAGYGAVGNMGKTLVNTATDMVQNNIQQANLLSVGPLTCGASSSISSLIMPQTAFVQVRRKNPYKTEARDYKEELGLVGYRSAYQGLVGSANGMGFVKCQNPNLSIVAEAGATQYEIEKIKTLLTAGIFT